MQVVKCDANLNKFILINYINYSIFYFSKIMAVHCSMFIGIVRATNINEQLNCLVHVDYV